MHPKCARVCRDPTDSVAAWRESLASVSLAATLRCGPGGHAVQGVELVMEVAAAVEVWKVRVCKNREA